MNTDIQILEDDKIIAVINDEKVECDVVFTYDSENSDDSYLAYTDNSTDEKGNLNIRFAKCSAFTGMKYVDVTDPEETKMLEGVLQEIIANQGNI